MILHVRARFTKELLKKDIQIPEMPSELSHVWTYFCEVFNPGGVGMGPYRTEFREIQAFAEMTHTYIKPSEVRLIRRLCEIYMEVDAEKDKQTAATKQSVPPGVKNLTTMKDTSGIRAIFANAGSTTPRSKAPKKAPRPPTRT